MMDVSGIRIIGEMTKEQIMEELLLAQRSFLESQDLNDLKKTLIEVRLHFQKKRLIEEAHLEQEQGPFGFLTGM